MGADQYTPETKEVRGAWLQAHRTEAWGGRIDLEARPKERLAEFDRWLDQVKAEAKAEALEEVATDLREIDPSYDGAIFIGAESRYVYTDEWLRDRAKQLRNDP